MAVTNINGVTINKITKSQYDAEVLAGNITSSMEQNEVWLFTDDQHVSTSEKANWNAKSDFSGSYNDLTNKPELFSGSYNDLTDKPAIPDVSGFETKTDAAAKLTEAKNYADTKVANLVNSAPTTLDTLGELATAIQENESVVVALNSAIGNKANSSDLSTVATSGSYNDLTDKPTIPTVPTNIGSFINDIGYLTAIPSEYVTDTELNNKGYLTSYTESDPTVPSHVKSITSTDISNWNAKSDFSGSYNDLTNKPELFSGSYNDLTDKPTIPTAVTKIWS